MLNPKVPTKTAAIVKIAGLSILFSISSAVLSNAAYASATVSERSQPITQPASQFQPIDQPLITKAIVTISGVGLIGLELWWFLGSKPQAKPEQEDR